MKRAALTGGAIGQWMTRAAQPRVAVPVAALPLGYAAATWTGLLPASPLATSALALGALAVTGAGLTVIAGLKRDRARLQEQGEDLAQLMRLDPLTGLLNRDAFNKALDDLSPFGEAGETVIALFFDLDRFKDVNDTLGHKVGDLLLIEVAKRAAALLPPRAAFARLGGDEFAAIMPLVEGERPEEYGHRIVSAIDQPFTIDGQLVSVGTSVGVAAGDPGFDDGHELLRRADTAMYEIKGSSRGGCRVFDDVLDGRQLRDSSIRVELGRSLIENGLALHYQPVVSARTGELKSVEALLRSSTKPLSEVPPGTIIQIAEVSGQIMPLTEWTLDTAMQTIRRLEDVPVAINISPIYFRSPEFIHRIFDKLLGAAVRPELLTIEVTEGILISDMDIARNAIDRLREVGVRVFLDDFGTGYSSLSYLQHFELDGLKLDKSFLRNVGDKRRATQIIRSVIDFGHSLDMKVVMEGIETEWQARLLQLLGCDLLQGYEVGMPMPIDELIEFRRRLVAHPRNASAEDAALPESFRVAG